MVLVREKAEHAQSPHTDEIEATRFVTQWSTHDGERAPQHRESGAKQNATHPGDRAQVQKVVLLDDPAEHVEGARRTETLPAARPGRAVEYGAGMEEHRAGNRDCNRHAEEPETYTWQARPPLAEDDKHHERPEQVELFLDRERPEVPQRYEVELAGVTLAAENLIPVGGIRHGRHKVAAQLAECGWFDQQAIQRDHQQRDVEGRKQAPKAAKPELTDMDTALALVFSDE